MFSRSGGMRRRGSVLILVVGVLAMLFVIGATQLMVARFEKQNAEKKLAGSNLKGVAAMVYLPLAEMFQNDALAATNADLDPALQDWADFAGMPVEKAIDDYITDYVDMSHLPTPAERDALRLFLKEKLLLGRSGDSLLASIEPYRVDDKFFWFATSLGVDALSSLQEYLNVAQKAKDEGPMESRITNGNPTSGNNGDADADGTTDARQLDTLAFGGQYKMFQRVIGHGGMVMLDRMTHPALLAQVIHPGDPAHANPELLPNSGWKRTSTDEARLRRRYLLPESTNPDDTTTWSSLPSNDLRKILPISLGYVTPGSGYRDLTPHWWPIGSDYLTVEDDQGWREARMTPGTALNENGYSASSDYYDRRHLMTVYSYDDLLRPQRNESRLLRLTNEAYHPNNNPDVPQYVAHPLFGQFFHVINPTAAKETVTLVHPGTGTPVAYDSQGRFVANGLPLAYGMMLRNQVFSLDFNRPGLRTPFSLRDTLVPPASNIGVDATNAPLTWGYQASYRRAAQLTGYYLAMIQNTTVPGSARSYDPYVAGSTNPTPDDLRVQYETALQLAVNTIDFADNADVNGSGTVDAADIKWDTNGDGSVTTSGATADMPVDPLTAMTYQWDNAGTIETVTVYGFEKQPFITEAYVKLMHRPIPPTPPDTLWKWEAEPDPTDSIYAVELYNPYMEDMRLDDFALKLSPTVYADLANIVIPAQKAIVLANTTVDAARAGLGLPLTDFVDPFIKGADTAAPDQNLFVAGTDFPVLTFTEGTDTTPDTTTAAGASDFKITQLGVSLVRKTVLHVETNSTSLLPIARLETASATNRVGARVVVDTLAPSGLGATGNNLAVDARFAADVATTDVAAGARPVTDWDNNGDPAEDRLVCESSLQRRKDHKNWHFTVSRQMVFPLPWFEHSENLNPATGSPYVCDRPDSPPQHNLLGTKPWLETDNPAGVTNQQIMARYMDGMEFNLSLAAQPTDNYPDGRPVAWQKDASNNFYAPVTTHSIQPAAPVHLLTSDMGLDAYGRCRAYPTTGTLLLVSRYAHVKQSPTPLEMPVTLAVTRAPRITNQRILAYNQDLGALRDDGAQLVQVDNGHLPIFDSEQVVLGEPRRLQMPWGQLVYDYFTALPIEELFQVKDFQPIGGPAQARVIDFYNEQDLTPFENAYKFVVNGLGVNGYGSSPVQELVATDGVNTIGPRVRGRINVNLAPWWVLDGLPMLPDFYDTNYAGNPLYNILGSLPVPELVSLQLDPDPAVAGTDRAAGILLTAAIADAGNHNVAFPTVHPEWARFLVSYREKRPVEGRQYLGLLGDSYFSASPGYAGVGSLCDVARRMPLTVSYNGKDLTLNTPLGNLRNHLDPMSMVSTGAKPYSYLGYLQMVAPMVRLQDWATVKSHVYTIYNVVGDSSEPPTWLRSQTTIDRTRCLYTNDLPDRVVQTEPISYFNAVSDQQ